MIAAQKEFTFTQPQNMDRGKDVTGSRKLILVQIFRRLSNITES